jgi:hypothetical protein
MRYRIYASLEADQQHFQNEDELIEALSSRGWELQQRAAEQLVERCAPRFRRARQSTIDAGRARRIPVANG